MTGTGAIRTTHTGSLPPALPEQARLQELLKARIRGERMDAGEFAELADQAVREVVGWQRRIGIDVVSSGELDRAGFMDTSRLAGWGARGGTGSFAPRDLVESGMAEWLLNSGAVMPEMNAGPVKHDPDVIGAELERLLRALSQHGVEPSGAFVPEPSPSLMASLGTTHYADENRFLDDVAAALSEEYRAIAKAGLMVQIDAPDLPLDWQMGHDGQSMDDYLARLRRRVQTINDATAGIPESQIRVHVCYGNWPGPHHYDITLPQIGAELYRLRAGTLVVELANRRHRWERRMFGEPDHRLPAGVVLAAGVIDSCSTSVEHEETVASELIELAGMVGPQNLMAATDCGFRGQLGIGMDRYVTEQKLRSLVRGAQLASERLGLVSASRVSGDGVS
jgi:5-methyltetrahydropteroyltriglutamate--homocysteine methyltransferase